MKKIWVLIFSISLIMADESITFSELVKLASQDLGTNIYLDKELKDYKVEFNIVDHQKPGAIYEYLKTVLSDNDMVLQYNQRGDFYFIKELPKKVEPVVLPDLPIVPDNQKKHYYMYKIRHITNDDVVKTMSIFVDEFKEPIKYTYLAQSDMIAYSATKEMHHKIKRMLTLADNSVKQRMIKITLFTLDKNKALSYGSTIRALSYNLDFSSDHILSALKSSNNQILNIKDSASFGFTLYALQGRGIAKIYQEPTLYLTNGSKTSVNFVKNVAYKESTTTYKDNTQTVSDQIKYRDIGFKLNVLPKIKDNWVFIDLELTSEQLLSLQDNIPLTQKISYHSKVKVYKGKPLLLTGLKKSSERIEKNGIPVLSRLPIIGNLFREKIKENASQSINILLEVI